MLWILRCLGFLFAFSILPTSRHLSCFLLNYLAIPYFHGRIDTSALFYSVQGVERYLGNAVWVDIMSYSEFPTSTKGSLYDSFAC